MSQIEDVISLQNTCTNDARPPRILTTTDDVDDLSQSVDKFDSVVKNDTFQGVETNVSCTDNQKEEEEEEATKEGEPLTSKPIFSRKNMSLWSYFYNELTRDYLLEHDEVKFTEKRRRIYTFMKIPIELEKFMTYSFFQCADAFLYVFTFLPLRFLIALFKLATRGCFSLCFSHPKRVLEPAQICDLLRGTLVICGCFIMSYMDVSMLYHLVRGQAIIKLYIFFNMLEVADKLFSSFGQDILDSLFWTATEPRGRKREHIGVILHLMFAVLYVFGHAMLVLFQVTTLNVAFNSHNKALLTIMMSNNFVELKGSVFKKFEKNNLFQMSCSDVRERFHFVVLLSIVCIRNLPEFSWNLAHFWVLMPDFLMVMVFEFMVDWVKHAFITRFNNIPAEVYKEYTVSIAYDTMSNRQRHAFSDYLGVVSRRMGFIPMPLAVLLIRVISQSLRFSGHRAALLLFMFYLCLITLKIFISIVLLGLACNYIDKNRQTANTEDDAASRPSARPSAQMAPLIRRSHSIGARLSRSASPDGGATLNTRPLRVATHSLLSNSTVSLQSMSLNEEFVSDSAAARGKPPSPLVGKDNNGGLHRRKTTPLSEIDRFTMCSNRIT